MGTVSLLGQALNRSNSLSTFTQWANKTLLHSGKWRDQAADLGVVTKREHITKFLTLWEHDCTCTEEGFDLEALH